MKLNVNTSSKNIRTRLDDIALQIMEARALVFDAGSHLTKPEQEQPGLILSGAERLLNLLEKDFDAVHRDLIDAISTPAPAGSEAQALLNLMLTMLKHWRAQEISGNEFEAWLEQGVSIASQLAEVQHG